MSTPDIGDNIIGDVDDISDIIRDARVVGKTVSDVREDMDRDDLELMHALGFTFLDHWNTYKLPY